MAVTVTGLQEAQLSFAKLAAIPDESILNDVVLPAAQIMVDAFKDAAGSLLAVRSGSLSGSFKVLRKGANWALVGPNQSKHPKSSQGIRHRRAQGGGGHYGGTNAEVAYIQEYGSTRITGTHFMERTQDEREGEVQDTMEGAFNELVDRTFGG